ncbi:MAG TPA: hypothetical protein VNE39_00645 [Planctomycetota bacterium]|nr:hypothetical protein [Planctomycetota bacterium]
MALRVLATIGLSLALAQPSLGAGGTRVQLKGLEAIKFLYQQGDYPAATQFGYVALWKDIRQPEALFYTASALEKLNDREQAAVFHHILLRVLDEDAAGASDPQVASRRALCQKALERLDGAYRLARADYLSTAPGQRFTAADKASDLWMTQVRCDLRGLHGLYAWKLVGGRKDAKPDWIHNTQGAMHRSGAKYMDNIQGRQGVLFCIPLKKSNKPSRLFWDGPAKGRLLRIGTMAYNFPYVLNVLVGDKQAFSKAIGKDAWEDLKILLEAEPSREARLVLELVIPESQRWAEGAFFDYIDFFEE